MLLECSAEGKLNKSALADPEFSNLLAAVVIAFASDESEASPVHEMQCQ